VKTILIIDDNVVSIRLIQAIAGRLGYDCATASSAPQALSWLDSAASVEMVITDQQMPGMTGLEFYAKVHERVRFRNLPVILCTGVPERAMIDEARRLGITHFIVKPITPKVVGEKIAAVESERPQVLEPRATAITRLHIDDLNYGEVLRSSRQELTRLSAELESAYGNGDRVTALMVCEEFRAQAEILGAARMLEAIVVLESTSTWRDTEEAVPLLLLEAGRLCDVLEEEIRPHLRH